MRALLIAGCALALAGGGVAAAGQRLGEVQPERTPEQLYPRTCGYCHGHNVGPIILGRGLSADVTAVMVRQGRGAMPAFRPTEISDTELAALAKWVETSKASAQEHGQ